MWWSLQARRFPLGRYANAARFLPPHWRGGAEISTAPKELHHGPLHPGHLQARPRHCTAPVFLLPPNGETLFSVRPDIPLDDALEVAPCLLASALGAVEQAAQNVGGDLVHGSAYLIEMSKAVEAADTLTTRCSHWCE